MPLAPSPKDTASRRYARTTFSTPPDDAGDLPLAGLRAASNRHAMASDDDDFRLRPGKIRDESGKRPGGRVRGVRARPTSFTGQIQQAIRRAGGNPSRLNGTGKGSGRFNARGRGTAVAAGLKNRGLLAKLVKGGASSMDRALGPRPSCATDAGICEKHLNGRPVPSIATISHRAPLLVVREVCCKKKAVAL